MIKSHFLNSDCFVSKALLALNALQLIFLKAIHIKNTHNLEKHEYFK